MDGPALNSLLAEQFQYNQASGPILLTKGQRTHLAVSRLSRRCGPGEPVELPISPDNATLIASSLWVKRYASTFGFV
jgi:hypothetical protein